MKFFVAVCLFAFLTVTLPGCATTFHPSGDCVAGESIILSTTGGNPTGLDRSLLMLNFAGLESDLYPKAEVIKFFDKAEILIDAGVTYTDLTAFLNVNVDRIAKYAGMAAVILGADVQTIGELGGPKKLSSCDANLVKAHIKNQRSLLVFF